MKANTDEMKNIASEINSLAVEYQTLITNLYNKFANMPTVTREWTGNKASEYVKYVMLDKSDLISIGSRIKDFSKIIINDANLIESNSEKLRKDEENG